MRFRVLGRVELLDDAEWRRIGAAKWRSLLAVLLVERDRVVSNDRIAAELWGERQPRTVDNQIYGYVARLRRLLGPEQLVTQSPGYRLHVYAADTDAGQFAVLAGRGRAALRSGDFESAARDLDAALELWRGNPYEDVPVSPMIRAEADRLAEARVDALEDWAEAQLARGEHGAVLARLADFITRHPLRERLRQTQMLALYRQGRQAEAIGVYIELRSLLAEELGVDPGGAVQRLYEQIVRADPALAVRPTTAVSPVHQLPPDIPDFTGRADTLAQVVDAVSSGSEDGPPPVTVLVGGPGVGKSSLAVHAAHAVRPRFADGQLYLDLGGTSVRPRDPAMLLAEVLGALGVRGEWVPDDLNARAALYRSLLARRRMLLVLDDAADAGQVRPLLPPNGNCAVLITTRRSVADLPGARHLELDVFAAAEARDLFTAIVGARRVEAEPEHAEAILRACGYLPLAIRISGGKLAGRAKWPLRALRERLDDESQRLDELRVGESGVRASFELSLRSLPDDAARGFALLGLSCARSVPAWVLGPLLGRARADDVMDVLLDASLVQVVDTDVTGQLRYQLPSLLRAYAVEVAGGYSLEDRRAAVVRLLGAWLYVAEKAAESLPPSLFRPTPGSSVRVKAPVDVGRDPLGWFEAERATALDAVALAAEWGLDELAWELAAAMVSYYDLRSLHQEWLRGHEIALGAVRKAGNLKGEAVLLTELAQVQIYRDQFDTAVPTLHRALELYRGLGDRRGEALATGALATIERFRGRHADALDHARQALELVIAAGDRHIEAQLRNGIAVIHLAQGSAAEAETWFESALQLSRQTGDVHREAVVLREMSQLSPDRALERLRAAHDMFEQLGDDRCLAYTLLRMGQVYAALRDGFQTAVVLTRAATWFQRDGDRMGEASCWQLLGELDIGYENRAAARLHLGRALALWQTFGAEEPALSVRARLEELEVG
ncbi:AfsR/SARP family transcriptional regulator [Kutzneria sp. 744]|uniref:AfsR/SARP family transcriptional regulator n=1 Tax=Kutzneria sp. (strain 744) TaxID=345341 RepID=UPI0003EEDFA5|nr:AfsR/SARP family transcriptional regulator [Kutzneria sp. 744]EWM10794.1 transcriptional regulator, SARP family [Kutzneria sp. 744]